MRSLLLMLIMMLSYPLFSQNLRSGGKLKPEQAIMDIRHYTLVLEVDPEQKTINGSTEIDLILSQSSSLLLLDLWNGLTVKQVLVNGKPENFTHLDDLIRITNSSLWSAGKIKIKVKKMLTKI